MKTYQTFTTQQKWAIIKRVEESGNKERELAKLGIPRSTYYGWVKNGCETKKKTPYRIWNKTPEDIEQKIKVIAPLARSFHAPGAAAHAESSISRRTQEVPAA